MLQNRVTPYGQIIKTTARGAWMGNRGLLHDDGQQILRPYKLKAWLTCLLEFKGWKRTVMSPRRYTELFFYDEATAYAAGHRPCFECRRQDYNHFKTHWLKGNPEYGFDAKVSIQQIDAILHRERIDKQGVKVKYEDQPDTLPDGTFIELDEKPYLISLLSDKLIDLKNDSGDSLAVGKQTLFVRSDKTAACTSSTIDQSLSK